MKAVPRPLVLVTENPLTVVWERSSVDPAVASLAFCPNAREGLDTRRIGVVDQEGDVAAHAYMFTCENVFEVRS